MFVFKAAVVGAGTMGGQIAQTIAAAGIPVVLKDIDQKLVDAGPRGGARRHRGPGRPAGREGEADRGAGRRPARGGHRPDHRHDHLRRVRRRRLRHRGRARADGDQAGRLRRARRRHARPRDPRLEHLVAVDHRDRRGDAAARQGRRLPLLLPGLGDAADRGRSRATTPRRDRRPAADNFAQAIRKQPITCAEVPGFVVNRILNWRDRRDLARAGGAGPLDQGDRRGVGAANVAPMGPYFLVNLLGLDTVLHVAEHLQRVLRRPLLRPRGHAAAGRRRQARRQDRRRRLLHGRRAERSRATPSPTSRSSSSCSR